MAEEKGSKKVWARKKSCLRHQGESYGYGVEIPASVGKDRLEELEMLGDICDPIENEFVIDANVNVKKLELRINDLEAENANLKNEIKKLESRKSGSDQKEEKAEIKTLKAKVVDLETQLKEKSEKKKGLFG